MKSTLVSALLLSWLFLPAAAQTRRPERTTLLDRDPDVIHLAEHVKKPIELRVIKEAPVYADKNGNRKLGVIKADQAVVLEAMTANAYKVRGEGTRHGVSGWVGPHAFASKDPNFVENLKKLHARQLEVQALIEDEQVAIGMTMEEAGKARGTPDKTKVKRTEKGQTGRWEYVDYEQVQHFNYIRDPLSGQVFRQLSHVTREEKGKTVIDFEDGVVTAVEESEQRPGSAVKIVVPPVIFLW